MPGVRLAFEKAVYKHLSAVARQEFTIVSLRDTPFDGDRPLISVIIATHNRRGALQECLEHFGHQSLAPGSFECLVVDDGSSDGTSETTSPVIDAGASAAAKANDEGGESMHEPLLTVL